MAKFVTFIRTRGVTDSASFIEPLGSAFRNIVADRNAFLRDEEAAAKKVVRTFFEAITDSNQRAAAYNALFVKRNSRLVGDMALELKFADRIVWGSNIGILG